MGSAGSKSGFQKGRENRAPLMMGTGLPAVHMRSPESMVTPVSPDRANLANLSSQGSGSSGRIPADQMIMHAYGDYGPEGSPRRSARGSPLSSPQRSLKMASQIGDHSVRQVAFITERGLAGRPDAGIPDDDARTFGRRVFAGDASQGQGAVAEPPAAFWKGSMVVSADGVLVYADGSALVVRQVMHPPPPCC